MSVKQVTICIYGTPVRGFTTLASLGDGSATFECGTPARSARLAAQLMAEHLMDGGISKISQVAVHADTYVHGPRVLFFSLGAIPWFNDELEEAQSPAEVKFEQEVRS